MLSRIAGAIRVAVVVTPLAGLAAAVFAWQSPSAALQVSSVASILVAAATFELAWVALLQIQHLQKQEAAREEADFRPVLIPEGQLPPESLWQGPDFHLHLNNVGRGLASNVEAVILPPKAKRKVVPPMFHAVIPGPIKAGDSAKVMLRVGGYMISEDDAISGIPMAVPPERTPEPGFPSPFRTQPRCTARITITCTDLFGTKHASVFDWQELGGWLAVKVIAHADAQIEDIDAKRRKPEGQDEPLVTA